jgi:predicted Fe-Mo cluster-binding NifX family protein
VCYIIKNKQHIRRNKMKIAITCENNQVFQHFGHTPGFAVFEIEDGKVVSQKELSSGGTGHGALATLLAEAQIDLLICGGIGGGAINALGNAGIEVVGGAAGDVREVAEAFAAGTLQVREDFHCNHHHHGEGHSCGSHSCGH